MVKLALTFLLLAWPPCAALAISAEELRVLTDNGEQARRTRDSHVKPGQPEKLLTGTDAVTKPVQPVSSPASPSKARIAKPTNRAKADTEAPSPSKSPARSSKYDTPSADTSTPATSSLATRRTKPRTNKTEPKVNETDGKPVHTAATVPNAPVSRPLPPVAERPAETPSTPAPTLSEPPLPVPVRTTATTAGTEPLAPALRETLPPSPAKPDSPVAVSTGSIIHEDGPAVARPSPETVIPSVAPPDSRSGDDVKIAPERAAPVVVLAAHTVTEPVHQHGVTSTTTASPAPPEVSAGSRESPAPPPDLYIPPARHAAPERVARSDAVAINAKRQFGITLGTWFKARLSRNVSNAEGGLVELTVEDDVPGAHRTLARGAILFAEKSLNESTRRLELRVVKGITPSRLEFQLNARGFDLNRVAGVNAIISGDTEAIASRGANRGLIAGARAAVREMLGTNPVASEAVRGASDSVLSDSSQAAERASLPTVTGFASAQELWLRVEETF